MADPAQRMKRFWKTVTTAEADRTWQIALDGRAVKTPARMPLAVPTRALVEAIAEEWATRGEDFADQLVARREALPRYSPTPR